MVSQVVQYLPNELKGCRSAHRKSPELVTGLRAVDCELLTSSC